jgi:Bardet-Biedl syndrome 9 protein
MTCGGFGGETARDLILVQSMDGRVAVYEQDVHAFTRRLPECLVPGPIVYIPSTDSFVTVNSALHVECFRYHVLAASQADGSEDTDQVQDKDSGAGPGGRRMSVTAVKRVTTEWSVCVGEQILNITHGRFCAGSNQANAATDILLLGVNCLYGLSEGGEIKMQKKLDFDPGTFTLYPSTRSASGENDNNATANMNMIVSSYDDSLVVYRQQRMIWSAKLSSSPIAVFVADYEAHRGMITTLDDSGLLSVIYLGTDPAADSVIVPETKEINYDDVDEEHRKLLGIIRASQSDTRMEPREKIIMRAQVPRQLDAPGHLEDLDMHEHILKHCVRQDYGMLQLTVKLFLTYTGAGSVSDVSVSLDLPESALTKDMSFNISSLKGGSATPMIMDITFYANAFVVPNSNVVKVSAMFLTASGEPRTAQCNIELPMFFFARLIPPVKEPLFKFKLDTNKPPVLLATLFTDMIGVLGNGEADIENTANYVLTFRYWVEDENSAPLNATILLSKNAGRYRVQSNYLPALWFVGNELCKRLQKYFASQVMDGGTDDFQMWYDEPSLPLQDFFVCIDDHFNCRVALNEKKSQLNDCAQQFRTIEKRLLVRFKDRNAVPLQQLDVIMAETYHRLMQLADDVGNTQIQLGTLANNLSCVTSLMLLLMKLKYKLNQPSFNMLQAHLSPVVIDNEHQGWQESTDAAMTSLLRTVLAKKSADSGMVSQANTLEMPIDTVKLKKHISIVADRLSKGAVLSED